MIIIHAKLAVHADKQEQFLEEVKALIAASQAEEGNVSYNLLKDTTQESLYVMVEVWKDHAAVASHNTSSHFVAFVGQAKSFLTAPLDVTAFEGQPLQA